MKTYILSILGIIIIGVMIDVIVPSGSVSKYIKSIFSIFVVAVLVSPVVNFIANKSDYKLTYSEYEINQEFVEFIFQEKAKQAEKDIEIHLQTNGFKNVDIILKYSCENNEIKYNSCIVNLKTLVISDPNSHINKYEFIGQAVKDKTGLGDAEIIFDE